MKNAFMLASLALAALGAALRVEAQALRVQFFGPYEPAPVPPPPGVEPEEWYDAAPAPARVCRKMCANDYSPCDPIYFKTEDGRCDGVHFGR